MRVMRNQRAEPRSANEQRARNKRDIWNNELTKCNKRCPNKNILSCCLFSSPMSHDNVPCSAASHTLNIIGFATIFRDFFLSFVAVSRELFCIRFSFCSGARSLVRSVNPTKYTQFFLLLLICQFHFLGHFAAFVCVQIWLRSVQPDSECMRPFILYLVT